MVMVFVIRATAILLAAWALAPPAQAYLDPGTGSTLLQGLLGGAALAVGLVERYWQGVRTWILSRQSRRSGRTSPDA
jgi:hypothetical protein